MRMLGSGAYKGGRGWTLGTQALLEDLSAGFLRRSQRSAVPPE